MSQISAIKQILRMVRESMYLFPPNNVKAVLGEWKHLFPPYAPYSELNLLRVSDRDSLRRLLRFVADATLLWYKHQEGKTSEHVPEIAQTVEKMSNFVSASRWIRSETPTSFVTAQGEAHNHEAWVYINGIITNRTLAQMNGDYLAALFGRRIQVIHNPTDAVLLDVIETMASRVWKAFSLADEFAYKTLLAQLQNPNIQRVVWIAHSQGTVIAANVVRKLQETHLDLLWKLELYTMANCASGMEKKSDAQGRLVPYMEHFANTNDLVCKLGVLAQAAQKRGDVKIEGPVFVREAWGHLLNAHYLIGIEKQLYRDPKKQHTPRLYQYLTGQVPLDTLNKTA